MEEPGGVWGGGMGCQIFTGVSLIEVSFPDGLYTSCESNRGIPESNEDT